MKEHSDLQSVIADAIARGDPGGWFEELYVAAGGDACALPWVHLSPRRELVEWCFERSPDGQGKCALVVGCGLGDDAEFLSGLKYTVTAFDVSQTAIDWCRQRFPDSSVGYSVADLFAPPAAWAHRFDLVLEVYTVQALPIAMRRKAVNAVANFVAPGGCMIAIGIGAAEDSVRNGPPWALTLNELRFVEAAGLQSIQIDRRKHRHLAQRFIYRAEYRRPLTVEETDE